MKKISKSKKLIQSENKSLQKPSIKSRFFTLGVRVHFVGIGGVGMCGLAELLYCSGTSVTGSDIENNTYIERLKKIGIPISIGHSQKNIQFADVIVYSSAVSKSNIELRSARKRGIPLISRSEALSEIMRLKRGVVVAGTHGKTTTTGLLANIFTYNKKDPTVMIGGRCRLFQSTARLGRGPWFIAESDESDGGFKHLSPEIALLTNIDRDHLDYYGSFRELQKAFLNFVLRVPFYGYIVAWGDQSVIRKLLSGLNRKIIFYGFNKSNHFYIQKKTSITYEVFFNKKSLGRLDIPLPGRINALNTLASLVVAMTCGLSFDDCKKSFKYFKGVDRRFEKKGELGEVDFYDDYAHHPTEVREVLSVFREKFGNNKRLLVLFQPHRFSRTKACWKEFLNCFKMVDCVFITDIYPAGEKPLKNINSKKLAQEIKHSFCRYYPQKKLSSLASFLKKGDVFITMGAGSIYKYGELLLNMWQQQKKKQYGHSKKY